MFVIHVSVGVGEYLKNILPVGVLQTTKITLFPRFQDLEKYMRQKGYGAHAVAYYKVSALISKLKLTVF